MKQQRLITECPACKARFQVTAGQLKIAHGKVRCGTCLEVFNAELCKVPEPKQAATLPVQDAPQAKPASAPDQPARRPAIPKAFIPAKKTAPEQAPTELASTELAPTRQAPTKQTAAIDLDKPVHILFNGTQNSSQETTSAHRSAPKARQTASHKQSFPDPDLPVSLHIKQATPKTSAPQKPATNKPTQQHGANKAALQNGRKRTEQIQTQAIQHKPLQVNSSDGVSAAPSINQTQHTLAKHISDAQPAENTQSERIRQALHQHQTSYQAREKDHDYLNPAEKKLQELLRNASNPLTATDREPEPSVTEEPLLPPHSSILALHPDTENKDADFVPQQTEPVMIRATHRAPGKTITLSLIILLALSGLLLQFLWFERNNLIRQPALTTLYKPVCELIDCRLTVPDDVPDVKTEQLIVQEHKEYQGVLKISMLLQNQATFEQPFPAIELAFSDRNGSIINRRTFQPAEYLNSATLNPAKMPLEHSIQVHFDVLDPGRAAVGYEVSLRPSSLTDRRL